MQLYTVCYFGFKISSTFSINRTTRIIFSYYFFILFIFLLVRRRGRFPPEVGRCRRSREIGSQAGRQDIVSQAQQAKHQVPGLGKVVRELEALKAEQDAAAEVAFAEETAVVVAVNVS